MGREKLSRQMLQRLPLYAGYLKSLPRGTRNISATAISAALGLHDVQVRKDLAAVSSGGRPKTGYEVRGLLADIGAALSGGGPVRYVIVGMGNMGRALALYEGFRDYNLRPVAFFDSDPALVGRRVGSLAVQPVEQLAATCGKAKVGVGIITVPPADAQPVCDALTAAGVPAIWNFAPVHLSVPAGVLVENENMAVSLGMLSRHLSQGS